MSRAPERAAHAWRSGAPRAPERAAASVFGDPLFDTGIFIPEVERVKEELTTELELLEFEISTLACVFAETGFFGHVGNFPNVHHGYLMTCMGRIDVLSSYWSGRVGSRGQTQRMTSFMERYLHPGRVEEHRVAVQMFRHTPMHTGSLRFPYDQATDMRYTWRVYFGEGHRPEWHYRITTEDARYQDQLRALPVSIESANSVIKALNVSITRFISDLSLAVQAFLADFEADASLQANYDNAQALSN